MIISHDQFRIILFAWMCVCVCVRVCVCWAVAKRVRSGSVAVVSDIFIAATDDCKTQTRLV